MQLRFKHMRCNQPILPCYSNNHNNNPIHNNHNNSCNHNHSINYYNYSLNNYNNHNKTRCRKLLQQYR